MTASSSNCPSPPETSPAAALPAAALPAVALPAVALPVVALPAGARPAVIACGGLAADIRAVCRRRGFEIELHTLSALLHDRPAQIAPAVAELARSLQDAGRSVVLAYADCGTYGALDSVCDELGLRRLAGLHCYDVLAGADRIEELLVEEPGTYFLTDFLVHSFRRTVVRELGLDRYPELVTAYFGNYRRIVWLAQRPSPALEAEAAAIADLLALPLVTRVVGLGSLEEQLERLVVAGAAERS